MAPKKKQEKMSLGTFLGDQSLGSWADEMDDMPMPSSATSRSAFGSGGGRPEYSSSRPTFGGDRGDRDRDFGSDRAFTPRDQLPLPTKPPYTAHLGNLSFDVTQADIQDFFAACEVSNVRLVEDKLDRKPKGFGYVEFGSLDGLKKALDLNGHQFQGRNVRISIAEPPKDRPEARELNDWSRKGPLPELPGAGAQRRPSERNFNRDFEAGSERSNSRRGSNFGAEGDGKTRDFGNWERKGPMSPAAPSPARMDGDIRRNEKSFERRGSPASWGEGREPGAFQPSRSARGGDRPEQSDRPERPIAERTPTAAEMDNQWRSRMRPDAPTPSATPTPDASTPSSPAPVAAPPAPASRPKLNLAKRTVSEAPAQGEAAATGENKSSIFGAARPIDTTARDKEVEAKRLAARQKKEEEDKALAEKRAAEKAEKADAPEKTEKTEKSDRPSRGPREKIASPNGRQPRGGVQPQKPAQGGPEDIDTGSKPRNFEILRRMGENGDGAAPELEEDTTANTNGTTNDEKSANAAVQEEGDATAQMPEEDGWNTVTKPNKKGGRGGVRA